MILLFFRHLFAQGFIVAGFFLFLSFTLSAEIGYRLGRHVAASKPENEADITISSTLTSGMVGLLAFTLGLSINFAQNRFEARRDLVLAEANAIGTAWLRTKLMDDATALTLGDRIEDYAHVRLAFTITESDADVPGLIGRTNALQAEIWQSAQAMAHRSPNPITTALITALNDMFDVSASQQFAYESRVPPNLLLMLYGGAIVTIGALGYQLGLAGNRQVVLTTLLLMMWSSGMLLIADLNQPRMGSIRADAAPLIWTIRGFGAKPQVR
ncbi:hypothetical protein HLH34_14270 [Gluconacetobacter azotocaptans]|uniref:DUF4239 domain-containing protein n=1 Tax=Gluconacetobacter azotocaptans TaxID=142834 RepID=A0A7W4PET7_9PROT|nr:hypothetical protein [Gluconacetobacter azotocaptans]MBB2191113.1 hypothetical protein [Gluconacetobacter azotocaptans]MBM9402276.1 hypothetical protein [Gluconacetobacter azotocaptans]GBQ33159.1 hypothetical protein AA13594_2555 [Gluconacetobacter azotocaptans DSM 13594]